MFISATLTETIHRSTLATESSLFFISALAAQRTQVDYSRF